MRLLTITSLVITAPLLAGCSLLVGEAGQDCSDQEPCPAGMVCRDGACAPGQACQDACAPAGTERCSNDESAIEDCSLGVNGCLAWTVTEDCAATDRCSEESGPPACEPDCPNDCTEGMVTCEGDQLKTCTRIEPGCIRREVTQDCAAAGEICLAQACRPTTCANQSQDAGETDIDCGGPCTPCNAGLGCGVDLDCASGFCFLGTCEQECPNNCSIGVSACFGSVAAICTEFEPDCYHWDTIEDCAQTGQQCALGACRPMTCTDEIKNGDESDVDCGGSCDKCNNGKACDINFDCASSYCAQGTCAIDQVTCSDGIRNQDESDWDCGGTICAPCPNMRLCFADRDCQSEFCNSGSCADLPNHCTNGEHDEADAETDVDCGGPCKLCAQSQACMTFRDCAVGLGCSNGQCASGPLSRAVPMAGAVALAFHPVRHLYGEHKLATASGDSLPRVWTLTRDPFATVEQVTTDGVSHDPDLVQDVAFMVEGAGGVTYLLSVDDTRTIERHNQNNWSSSEIPGVAGRVMAVTAPTADLFSHADISDQDLTTVYVRDGHRDGGADSLLHQASMDSQVTALAFSPRGVGSPNTYALAAGSAHAAPDQAGLKVWLSRDWSEASPDPLAVGEPVRALAFHPNGSLLAVAVEVDGQHAVHIYQTTDWSRSTVAIPAPVHGLAFAPDRYALAVGTDNGRIQAVCDTGAGWAAQGADPVHDPNPVYSLAVSPDGLWLVSGSTDMFRVFALGLLFDGLGCLDL